MKLAEALLIRADAQKKVASLRERIARNAIVQEGEKPAEDPMALLKEAAGVLDELERLINAINAANLKHKLADGRTLTQAIALRDKLILQHSIIQSAINGTRRETDRYSTREIKWKPTLDVRKLQKQSDDLSKQLRELNAQIQEANWRVDIK